MSTSSTNRNRWMPAAPKAPLQLAIEFLRRPDVWLRVALCTLVSTCLFLVMTGWNPAFRYRLREAPTRNLHAHTEFKYFDYRATEEEKKRVLRNFRCYYEHDRQQLDQLRNALTEDLFLVIQKDFLEVKKAGTWDKFFLSSEALGGTPEQADEISFDRFRDAITGDEELAELRKAIKKAFIGIDSNGLLKGLAHDSSQGNLSEIKIYDKGDFAGGNRLTPVSKVRIAEIADDLKKSLAVEVSAAPELIRDPQFVSARIFDWLRPRLPETLAWDKTRTAKEAKEAAQTVMPVEKTVSPGDPLESERLAINSRIIHTGIPLNEADIELLTAEHQAWVQAETVATKIIRSLFFYVLCAVMYLLITQYLYFRSPKLLSDLRQFSILLGLMFVALAFAWLLAWDPEWRSEVVPVTMFAMVIAIAYHIELALILGALVSVAFTVAHGYGLAEFVVLTAASSASAMMCRQIRSRTKLVSVGFIVAVLVFPTAMGVHYLMGQPMGWALTASALWYAGGAAVAGLLMTGVLPFLERIFDIQTDISLLELSDANHPLLKELVQRAPGTYNHSINVASMSEAAADAIGANGLLCRVGAYFHDVGKLRKPEYFIENQAGGTNKHDDLVPTMSTLVIIAHVKDGAEIARKHRLPRRIIELIEQHHGTTLVEYFYRRAQRQLIEQSEGNDDEKALDEGDFRYPGPKPQTREAAVMMLADTVESASRALRDPAPARIETLVKTIAKKKIDDGQFDECQITIEQLHRIEASLIKSVNAMYHARVKYPEKQLVTPS